MRHSDHPIVNAKDTDITPIPPIQTAWGYLRHELFYIMWAIMEAALLTPFALALMLWATKWPPSLVMTWLVLLILLPLNLSRLMTLAKRPITQQRHLLLTTAVILILLTLRTTLYRPTALFDLSWLTTLFQNFTESGNNLWGRDVGIITLMLFAWWRGILMITRHPSVDLLGQYVRRGGLIVAPIVIWTTTRTPINALPYVALFFLAALTAVSLVRVEQVEHENKTTVTAITPRWFTIVVATSTLIVTVSSGIALFITRRPDVIAGGFAPIWLALRFATTTIWLLFRQYILTPLIPYLNAFFLWLSQLLTPAATAFSEEVPTQPTEAQNSIQELLEQAQDRERVELFLTEQLIILIGLVILLIIALRYIGVLYRRYQVSQAGQYIIDAGTTPTPSKRKPSLAERLRQQWQQLRQWRTVASIRRIYQQMCDVAEHNGYPRGSTQTPYEYLLALQQLWPNNQADARLITNAFVKIRYGELPESKEELKHIITTWEQLRAVPIRNE